MKRKLILSPEYIDFEQNSTARTREKLLYAISILESVYPTKQICKKVDKH